MENNDNNGIMGAPPGFKFDPKDDEIIRYYLMNKIHGHQYPWLSIIRDFDLYGERGPWDLLKSDESPVYVFARSKNLTTARKQRTCSFGTWKYQKNEEIEHGGQCIGYKALLTFIPDAAKIDAHQFGGSWHMSEFCLPDSRDKECFVVCKVSFKYDDIQSNKKRSLQEMTKTRASKKARFTSSNSQRSGQCSGASDVPYSVSNMRSQQKGVEQCSGAVDVPYSVSSMKSQQQGVEQGSGAVDVPYSVSSMKSQQQRVEQCSGAIDVPYSVSNMTSQLQEVEQFSGTVDLPYSISNLKSEQQGVEQCSGSVVSQEPSSSWSFMTMAGDMIQGGGGGAESVLTIDENYRPDLFLDLSEIYWDFDEAVVSLL